MAWLSLVPIICNFLVPDSTRQLLYQCMWYVLTCLWDRTFKIPIAFNPRSGGSGVPVVLSISPKIKRMFASFDSFVNTYTDLVWQYRTILTTYLKTSPPLYCSSFAHVPVYTVMLRATPVIAYNVRSYMHRTLY